MESSWYSRNKERARDRQNKWNEKNVTRNKEWAKKYYQSHKQDYEKRRKQWRKDNPDKLKQHAKTSWQRVKADSKKLAYHNTYQSKWSKKRVSELRIKVLGKYGGNPPRCNCCKINIIEFLAVDHINGGGSAHRKSLGNRETFFKVLMKDFRPDLYQILCHNCNMSKGFYGKCPHKAKLKS